MSESHRAQSQKPKTEDRRPKTYVAWPLEEAREALAGEDVTIIETAPPRAAGPLGAWRVLRCRVLKNGENGAPRYELLVARAQLPKETIANE